MRPVRRGVSPIAGDYKDYKDAKIDLISRISLGEQEGVQVANYCSYCESPISSKNLAVEHIKFKKASEKRPESKKWERPDLEGCWSNFLLACSSCNSIKGTKSVFFNYLVFPDRDNTFSAFIYKPDGEIKPNPAHRLTIQNIASNTISLIGLNKKVKEARDAEEKLIVTERKQKRMEIWILADKARDSYEKSANSADLEHFIVSLMLSSGFFSVWMTVFKDYSRMKNLFIDSISGTRQSGCFDHNGNAVNAHSNLDKLEVSKFKVLDDRV